MNISSGKFPKTFIRNTADARGIFISKFLDFIIEFVARDSEVDRGVNFFY